MTTTPSPLSPITNQVQPALSDLDLTPVGDRDKRAKIQLSIELRWKDIPATKRKKKVSKELVLEVGVLFAKNLPQKKLEAKGKRTPTFVKLKLLPGDSVIHSTELKMDKKADENMDFIELFDFHLREVEELKGKVLEVLVCDKRNTRHPTIYGQTEIDVGDFKIGKPICTWYNLTRPFF